MKRKQRKMRITKGERLLYVGAAFFLCFTLVMKIFCGAGVGRLSMNIEQLKYEINTQEKKNESLTMKVNELTSFDKVKEVIAEMGLAYNNENIIVVND